jgi:phosphorylcholine metabolism protein LicD
MKKEKAASNMAMISSILDSLGAIHWLEGGTLLGAYRQKDFCEDDEDDVDFGVWGNYQYLIPEIIKRAEAEGFALYKHYTDHELPQLAQQLAFKKDKLKVDVIFYEKKDDKAWGCVYRKHEQGFACIPRVVPSHYFELLDSIDFYGSTYLMPFAVEKYLEYLYGDWKTPRHRSTYSCYKKEDLHALDFEFKRV